MNQTKSFDLSDPSQLVRSVISNAFDPLLVAMVVAFTVGKYQKV